MTCKQVQEELLEYWGSTERLSSAGVAHVKSCEQCRNEALLLSETQAMVHSLPFERAPDGFTDQVMARVAREERRPVWRARVADWLLPARQPAWVRAAAVGAVLALMVAGGAFWYGQMQQPAHQTQVMVSSHPTQMSASEHLAVTDAELDELMVKHQMLESIQPLADDVGVGLVVYTSQ